jgi:protoheme IX farnesyltransferase
MAQPIGVAAETSRALAYLELSKPRIGAMVLVAACVGYYVSVPSPEASLAWALRLLWMLVGTGLVAVGANALNQLLEVEHDAQMVRTAGRPLPSGRLSGREALVFGLGTALVGACILALLVNWLSASVAALTFLSYVFVYTPLKRVTPLCVFIGAVPGALPPVIGWTAGSGSVGRGAVLLFAILFFWQLPHFAAIAWQYREDYARGGYPMLPVVDPDGRRTQLHLITHTVGLLVVSLFPAMSGMAGPLYAVAAVSLGFAFLLSGIVFLSKLTREAARLHVLASVTYLPLLLAVMMVDKTPA